MAKKTKGEMMSADPKLSEAFSRLAEQMEIDHISVAINMPGFLDDVVARLAEQDEIIKQLQGVKTRAEIEAEIERVDHDIAVGREGRSCGELLERKRGLQSVLVDKPTGGEGGDQP